ncbi:MAG TPA: hypothetical protein DCQ30_06610 [Acidimicrobiaceae bacterium]|nr:hypothetical protein [Acidimicrobiaceae bacterium]
MKGTDYTARRPSHFADAVVLTKLEVFDALEACAQAERALLRCGRPSEAAAVAAFFELLEDRVLLDPLPGVYADGVAEAVSSELSWRSGSNSSDREFTQ